MLIPRILIIDDESKLLQIYQQILLPSPIQEGLRKLDQQSAELFQDSQQAHSNAKIMANSAIDLVTVSSGEEGVEQVRQAKTQGLEFAVAFIDMHMPGGMDGLETADKILSLDRQIEIVIVTAYSHQTRDEIAKTLGEGRFLYLKKPFHPDEILQLSQSLISKWLLAREREQLRREQEIFSSNMSHELRHPLQVILGVCDTLLNFPMTEDRRNQFILDIQTEAQRLTQLASHLNQLSSPRIEMNPEALKPISLSVLLERIARLLEPEAVKKKLTLSCQIPVDTPLVLADENSLVQVLINLVVNAINYTDHGGVNLSLDILANRVRVIVSDSGVGIAPIEHKAIFHQFYRVKEQALKIRGHGLGLSIVQDILKAHDSTIELSSTLGQGSCFSFLLRRADL